MSKCGVCSLLLDVIVLSFQERLFFLFLVFFSFRSFCFFPNMFFFCPGVTKAMFFQSSTPNNYHVTSPEKWGVGAFSWKKKGGRWNRAAWRTESFSVEPIPNRNSGRWRGAETARKIEFLPYSFLLVWIVRSLKQKNPQHLGNAGVCFFFFWRGGLKWLGLGSIG